LDDETLNPEPQTEEAGQPDEKLEVVFDTDDESEALIVKGLLESNGLEVLMSTPESPSSIFPMTTGHLGEIRLAVRAEQADDARQLIEESEEEIPEGEKTQDFE
jgi:hypothetical protein